MRTYADTQFMLEASFNAVSDLVFTDARKYLSLGIVDKTLQFISLLCHQRKDIRLGGVICLYLITKANEHLQPDVRNVMSDELLISLREYQNQEKIYIVAALEVVGLVGPCPAALEKIMLIKNILVDPDMSELQTNCVCALLQLGFTGLKIVVDLAAKDFNSLQPSLLSTLLNVRTIQRIILVPSLLSQLNNSV